MEHFISVILLVGRVLVGLLFLWSAVNKLRDRKTTVSLIKSKNVPQPNLVYFLMVALQFVGSLFLILGVFPRLGALLLLIYVIPYTLVFHRFWSISRGTERATEKTLFMKTVAIIGALVLLFGVGAGKYSLMEKIHHNEAHHHHWW